MAVFPSLLWPETEPRGDGPHLQRPLNIGHRGAAGEAPENTMAAFDLALRQGADGIEFDVHLSADGVPVVIHDWRLERTTSGSGRVHDHSVATLRRLDAGSWFNRRHRSKARGRFVGIKIPSLAEVLEWVREQKCQAFIEIKQHAQNYPGVEEKVLEEAYRQGVVERATVLSFDVPTLRRIRQLDCRIPMGINFTRPLLAVRRAKTLGAARLGPHWAFVSRHFIRRAHSAGLQVFIWDLDRPRWMRRRIAEGVDGIITNYPARLAEVLVSLKPVPRT